MIERMAFSIVTMAAFAAGLPSAAQPERQREPTALERELRTLAELDTADLQRELAKAREQLARSATEIARLSAQMTQPVTTKLVDLIKLRSGNAVLGVSVEDTDLGASVIGVSPGGPAAKAGIAAGDTIVAINDVELGRRAGAGDGATATLLAEMAGVAAGEEVKLRLMRDGDYRDVVVMAGQNIRLPYVVNRDGGLMLNGGRDGPKVTFAPLHGLVIGPWRDVELVSLTPTLGEYFGVDEGLLVVRAGRASELGLRDGDVILDIGGREPQSPEHALRILQSFEAGESLQAAIMRQRRRETLAITGPNATD
jgi:S1-C subfamily serine protease